MLPLAYSVSILILLAPVFLLTKSYRKTLWLGLAILLFLFLNKDVIFGTRHSYHDTFWTYEMFSYLVKQWISKGFSFGWNPYMNAGEPLYLFSNYFLRPAFVLFFLFTRWITISGTQLFHLSWFFMYINFCVGAFLLFSSLFDDFRAAFFCFVCTLLSGCFYINLGQPTGLTILYFFPCILFGIISFLKKQSPWGLVLAIIYLGMAVNFYLPQYLFLICFVFVIVLLGFNQEYIKITLKIAAGHYKLIIAAAAIAVLAAGPAIFVNAELKDFISPARGTSKSALNLAIDESGEQPRVNAGVLGYRLLMDRVDSSTAFTGGIHHGFYIGIITLLLVLLGVFGVKYRLAGVFLITCFFAFLVGLGQDFVLFRLLVKYLPGFNMVRHSFGFSQFVCFLLICVSGFGLRAIISQKKYSRIVYPLILIILVFDLCFFNQKIKTYVHPRRCIPYVKLGEPLPVKYPFKRTFLCNKDSLVWMNMLNLYPLFFKQASVTSSEDKVFFRARRLNEMLNFFAPSGYETALSVDVPAIYFTNNAGICKAGKDKLIRQIYEYSDTKEPVALFQENEIDFVLPQGNTETKVYFSDFIIEEQDNPNRIILIADSSVDGFLVKAENFHRGWRAWIDGIPAEIYRANYAFSAVKLLSGRHRVVFEFRTIYPLLFWGFILISILMWIGLNCYLWKGFHRRDEDITD